MTRNIQHKVTSHYPSVWGATAKSLEGI